MIEESVEIERSPEEVFAYLSELDKREAKKQVPQDQAKLKQRLESGA